jgi:hypothetical protein
VHAHTSHALGRRRRPKEEAPAFGAAEGGLGATVAQQCQAQRRLRAWLADEARVQQAFCVTGEADFVPVAED